MNFARAILLFVSLLSFVFLVVAFVTRGLFALALKSGLYVD